MNMCYAEIANKPFGVIQASIEAVTVDATRGRPKLIFLSTEY